jgi:hypothetical protein
MLNTVSEKTMHRVRWLLTFGWFTLITSLFYDPITMQFTKADNLASPFHVKPETYFDPALCAKIRDVCLEPKPFEMTALMWWAMIVPCAILILLLMGHEVWRRICPLSFLSQLPRALGIQRRRKVVDPVTGETRSELVTIGENSWLGKNHLYVQFGLFVAGLGARILFINSDRHALGYFLIATILCAIVVGYLYAGKSWCQYFCPMSPVQLVYTGPRALLGSQAHLSQKPVVTQSMCRTVEPSGKEQSACVGCKSNCIDIDAEKTYWSELKKPGRRLVQYGYLGMVIAFYLYYFLYAGDWNYYFTGAWTHEEGQIARMFDPGFYIAGQAIPIPKYIAVFLTYAVAIALTFSLGMGLEKSYRWFMSWRGHRVSAEQAQHVAFTIFTATSFWVFFSYGARPWLNKMPIWVVLTFNALVVLVGSMWLFRTFGRTRMQYDRESMATSLRKQLHKLQIDPVWLDGISLDDLSPNEVYTLVKVLPEFSQQLQTQTYMGVVLDSIQQKIVDVSSSFEYFGKLRQDLRIKDTDHFDAIEAIAITHPDLLLAQGQPQSQYGGSYQSSDKTVGKAIGKRSRRGQIGKRGRL